MSRRRVGLSGHSPAPALSAFPFLYRYIVVWVLGAGLAGCGWFGSDVRPEVPHDQRLTLAVLRCGIDIEITKLSSVQTVTEDLSPEQESLLITKAIREVEENARRLLYDKLRSGEQFRLISLEETDVAVQDLGFPLEGTLNQEQMMKLRDRLGVDLLITGTVLDYGKVRWQWLAAGMLADMTWESIALGLATSWNPAAIFGNVGFELLTSTPVWFGGGYLFGVAFRPVRVEAMAVDPIDGEAVWKETEVAVYLWKRLKQVPEEDRKKKEVQLGLNLKKAMEDLAESLLDAGLTRSTLWERRLPAQDVVAF
ncbi:MAG: hypothetical protein E6K63_10780 [Nitrospirae bacterium]|nr:MAG: hypothetical protein E6K63_10780 [Nitrospirota bacterium]